MPSSTGYRGISRQAKHVYRPDPPVAVKQQPPLILLTRPVKCDQCGTLIPAGQRGRYYTYRDGVRFFGQSCH